MFVECVVKWFRRGRGVGRSGDERVREDKRKGEGSINNQGTHTHTHTQKMQEDVL